METLTVYFVIAVLMLVVNVVLSYITYNNYKRTQSEADEMLSMFVEFTTKFEEVSLAVKTAKEKAVEFYEKSQIKNERSRKHFITLWEKFLKDLKKEALKLRK